MVKLVVFTKTPLLIVVSGVQDKKLKLEIKF